MIRYLRKKRLFSFRRRLMSSEATSEGFPTLKKYAPIWVPVLSFGLMNIWIINDPSVRAIVENFLPSYIEFLRMKIGFDDEGSNLYVKLQTIIVRSNSLFSTFRSDRKVADS